MYSIYINLQFVGYANNYSDAIAKATKLREERPGTTIEIRPSQNAMNEFNYNVLFPEMNYKWY